MAGMVVATMEIIMEDIIDLQRNLKVSTDHRLLQIGQPIE